METRTNNCVTAASRCLEVAGLSEPTQPAVGETSGLLGPKATLVNGTRRDPTPSLPLEDQSPTKKMAGKLVKWS